MARDEKIEHLRKVPLFSRMNQRQLERLGQLADEIEVGLDEVLAEQGRLGHEFFIVLDGHPDTGWEMVSWQGHPVGGDYLEDPGAEDPTGDLDSDDDGEIG